MLPNLEAVVPGLAEMRRDEAQARALAFSGISQRVCGILIRPFTPEIRLKLQLLGNAFATGGDVDRNDLMQFLWFLSEGWLPPGGFRGIVAASRQRTLRKRVRRLDVDEATREIRTFLVRQLQDMPEASLSEDKVDRSPWVHWMAQEATFFMNIHGGFTLESYRATPYLVLQQIIRAWKVNHPDSYVSASGHLIVDEPTFLNGSDRLIAQWHRRHRAAAAEIIKAQRYRI